MPYSVGGLIRAADFNILATGSPDGTPNHNVPNVNSLLGVGYKSIGYNSVVSLVTPVAVDNTITAANWSQLISAITTIAVNQGTQIDAMITPAAGDTITAIAPIQQNIQRIFSNPINSYRNNFETLNFWNYSPSNTIISWKNYMQIEVTVTFSSADNARIFFNRGGAIQLHPYYNISGATPVNNAAAAVNRTMSILSVQLGQVYLTGAPSNGTILAGTTPFTGITQRLGTFPGITTNPLRSTVNKNFGYQSLRTSPQTIVKQLYSPSAYDLQNAMNFTNSYIEITAATNSPSGPNGDNGNSIKFAIRFNQVANNNINATLSGFNMELGTSVVIGIPPTNNLGGITYSPTVSAVVSAS